MWISIGVKMYLHESNFLCVSEFSMRFLMKVHLKGTHGEKYSSQACLFTCDSEL